MGARAQVKITDTGTFLYTHWGSGEIVEDVRAALARRERWNDPEYLARIIFDQMVGIQQGTETGFGIGTSQHGDIDILVEVNCKEQTVTEVDPYSDRVRITTFKDFIE
jgi:hypothetical protein